MVKEMTIKTETFLKTFESNGREYGFALDEYEGKFSLCSVETGQDGTLYPRWCFPQIGRDKKPSEKSIPMKINMGDDMTSAASVLRLIADMLDGGDFTPKNDVDSIPF